MWKRPLLFLLLKIKGYFVFVLSPVGPTFDLDTKRFFCRVSDYALSDGGNRFSQFGLFHTVLKRHFSVRRSNLTLAARSWVQQNRPRFSPGVISSALAPYLAHGRSVSRVEKNFVDRKVISSTGSFLLAFSEWKALSVLNSYNKNEHFYPERY